MAQLSRTTQYDESAGVRATYIWWTIFSTLPGLNGYQTKKQVWGG